VRAMLLLELSADAPALPVVQRRSRAQGRAQRWDTGPAPTARDLAALRFIGEQYAVRVDVAAVLLTRLSASGPQGGGQLSRRAVREQLGRWEQAGWAERRRRGKASWHLADAALPTQVPETWQQQGITQAWELVEVELTQKARPRVLAALKTRPPHTLRVTYYVPPQLHPALSAQLAGVVRELGGRPPVAVELLPTLAGLTAGGAP
jgi:hypothetical protein